MTNPDRTKYETVKLADVQARGTERPAGYVDDVLSLAVQRDDTHVLLTRIAYYALVKKYTPITAAAATGYDGSALWELWHAATEPSQSLVDAVVESLPCGTCKAGILAIIAETPPDLSSLDGWRRWVVAAHNAVNVKLGRPEWTYAESAARWGW